MAKKREFLFFTLIMLVALFFSSFCLKTSPPFWFDEGIFYQVVKNLAFLNILGVQLSPGIFNDLTLISLGYPVFYPAAMVFRLLGASLLVERGMAVFFLLALVAVCYFLVRKCYGVRSAIFTSVLIVTFAPLYGNGKSFLGEVPGLFFLVAGLLILCYLPRVNKSNFWLSLSAGVVLGMAASVKPSFLPILPALLVGVVINWRIFLATKKGREALIVGFIGLSTSLLVWILTQFNNSTSVAGVLAHFSNPYYVNDWLLVITNNLKRFVVESTPLHCLLLLLIATYFLIKRFWKKEIVSVVEITIFVFVLLTLVAYLRTAGWYRYFFPAHFLLFLFIVPAVSRLFDELKIVKRRTFLFALFLALLLLAQIFPLSKNTLSCNIDAPSAVESYFANLGSTERVLFYSLPQLAARYPNFDFFQYIKMSEHLQLGRENLSLLDKGFFTIIFVESGLSDDVSRFKNYYLEKNIHGISIYRKKN